MQYILITLLFGALAALTASGRLDRLITRLPLPAGQSGRLLLSSLFGLVAIFYFALISIVIIDQDRVGHMKKIYFGSALPEGRVIAVDGQQGPQAEILGPGFHFIPMVNFIYTIEQLSLVEIAPGEVGIVTALDGVPLAAGQFIATRFPQSQLAEMLNAEQFLTEGGEKGPQLAVLPPGRYRLNRYLFSVQPVDALDVPKGTVAVIKSNVREQEDCPLPLPSGHTGEALVSPLVPIGCPGVQEQPKTPNRYYLNTEAYDPVIVPTTIQTWSYKGGYTQREISLTVDSEGNITQRAKEFAVPIPKGVADAAITTTIEGWRVPVEVRVLVQVNPLDAPRVVAAVGTLNDVEEKIGTPTLRSVVRNVTGEPGRQVLDLINKRGEIEQQVAAALSPELAKAGVTLKEIRFGDPIIPPELLVARQREQLATQLEATYEQEQMAQLKRVEVERARAEATEQPRIVAAEINVKVAEQTKRQLQLQGEGEKLKLMEIAAGQRAQVEVLGQESAKQLAMLKEILAAAVQNPEIVKVPSVLVGHDASSLEGAAAVLGASNIVQWARDLSTGSAATKAP